MTNTLTPERALQALDCMLVACGPSPKMGDGTSCYDLIRTALTSLPSPPVSGEVVELTKAANYLVGLLDTKKLFQDNPEVLTEKSTKKLDEDIEWAISNLSEKAGEETYEGFDRPDVEASSPSPMNL